MQERLGRDGFDHAGVGGAAVPELQAPEISKELDINFVGVVGLARIGDETRAAAHRQIVAQGYSPIDGQARIVEHAGGVDVLGRRARVVGVVAHEEELVRAAADGHGDGLGAGRRAGG